jgi:hypothetical protein
MTAARRRRAYSPCMELDGYGALPNVIVIGAMKCATTALHEYLDAHPQISMSRTKELNFFNGPEKAPHDDAGRWWRTGQWHRGIGWYASQFDPTTPFRGESSPAYTSPSAPEVAARMAAVVPRVRLVYLVRDPVERAVSQYFHHYRDGTERRPVDEAVLDPASQYLSRSRYWDRLQPFLGLFDREQVHVVVQERLLHHRDSEIGAVYAHVGVDADWHDERHARRVHVGDGRPEVSDRLRVAVMERLGDDVAKLQALLQDELREWS